MANLVFLIAVIGLYVAAYRRPGFACGYVLSAFVLEQCAQAFVPLAGYNQTLCNYLIAVAVILGIIGKVVRTGPSAFRLAAPTIAVLVLIAYCYATVLWSLFPSLSYQVLNAAIPYIGVFVLLGPLLVSRTEEAADALHSTLWCSTVSLGILVLFADWGGRGVILPYGGDAESNPLAVTKAAGTALIVLVLAPTIQTFKAPVRIVVVASVLTVVLFAFLRSASRGQIVASVLATFLFSTLGKKGRWFPLVLVLVGVIFSLGFLEEEVSRNAYRWEAEQVEGDIVDARLGKATLLLRHWSESSPVHLALGLGHGTSRDARVIGGYPHFVPAEVLAEEGVLGALMYVVVLLVAVVYLLRAYRMSGGARRAWVIVAAALLFFEFQLTFKQGSLLGASSFLLLLVIPGSLAHFTKRTLQPAVRGPTVPQMVGQPTVSRPT